MLAELRLRVALAEIQFSQEQFKIVAARAFQQVGGETAIPAEAVDRALLSLVLLQEEQAPAMEYYQRLNASGSDAVMLTALVHSSQERERRDLRRTLREVALGAVAGMGVRVAATPEDELADRIRSGQIDTKLSHIQLFREARLSTAPGRAEVLRGQPVKTVGTNWGS
ncbi:MAG: hypothetical protein ACKVPX_13395 [Myxococcaceae bacterium]